MLQAKVNVVCHLLTIRIFNGSTMDFTDPFSIHDVFENIKPDVVIHAGAMSKPDECEMDQMKAYLVNVEGTVQLLD